VVEIGVVRAVDHYIHGAERNQRRIHWLLAVPEFS
jgi:hypothetical protein